MRKKPHDKDHLERLRQVLALKLGDDAAALDEYIRLLFHRGYSPPLVEEDLILLGYPELKEALAAPSSSAAVCCWTCSVGGFGVKSWYLSKVINLFGCTTLTRNAASWWCVERDNSAAYKKRKTLGEAVDWAAMLAGQTDPVREPCEIDLSCRMLMGAAADCADPGAYLVAVARKLDPFADLIRQEERRSAPTPRHPDGERRLIVVIRTSEAGRDAARVQATAWEGAAKVAAFGAASRFATASNAENLAAFEAAAAKYYATNQDAPLPGAMAYLPTTTTIAEDKKQ